MDTVPTSKILLYINDIEGAHHYKKHMVVTILQAYLQGEEGTLALVTWAS